MRLLSMQKRNPWSIYCVFVSHRISFGKNFYPGLQWKPILQLNVSLSKYSGLGKFDLEKDFLSVNHILLLAKYFIYKCELTKVIPSLLVFKAKLKTTYKLELYVANSKEFY